MNLHEYQAKSLLSEFGIPVPPGALVQSADDVGDGTRLPASESGRWVVKAQVHSGARGKAGGVRLVDNVAGVTQAANDLIGTRLVTLQSGPVGLPVDSLLVEPAADIRHEYYLAITVDRALQRVVMVASSQGGMDIEAVADQHPESIHRAVVNPTVGLAAYQARELAFSLGLSADQMKVFVSLALKLYRAFIERDAALIEINPLAALADGQLAIVDAKVALDDNAEYRQAQWWQRRDIAQEDPAERKAIDHGLNYVSLDGNIACMVNGAGLAMATMDLIQHAGGMPANFLDVGGGTSAAKVTEAFKLILENPRVEAILVNIFGGIVRCDLIAEGITEAAREVALEVPTVVRLAGTNAEQGRRMLAESGLALTAEDDLAAAANRAVALANTKREARR
ncbi:ADP-forming succinate--CoA ligase subunit beta [Guyparkeria sp. SCN-R1]|uniref:ADP-forming succinate--CoA ligase subunit beta n=1 Tax=Guyparkeria sp. SCN-R1 TaxID=2341113 RepID=UPI000F64C30F|nr:ADP-forming succinate--CoA ligase subunit beta [Guyparkeria sp. SCN-R1]RRQ20267.1 ADP-forming succinate--CoA ligase subunit beta [Guyparkeria sp. SCN-R1]